MIILNQNFEKFSSFPNKNYQFGIDGIPNIMHELGNYEQISDKNSNEYF